MESFERLKSSSITQAYQQYILLLILYSVLLGIVSVMSSLMVFTSFQGQLGLLPHIGSFFVTESELIRHFLVNWSILLVYLWFLILMFIIFVKGLVLHVFVILFGGEQGLSRTILAILYASTPFLLFGWIPFLGIIGLIWSIILCMIGIKIFQDLPWWKAVTIIIIPILLVIIGVISVLFVIFSFIGVFTPGII